ncbi:MAG: nucleoside deaminase [Spirochaetaceae bacterium]|nr:MAG: nucleoside deaminase [Spirochaetaceae bacterium]
MDKGKREDFMRQAIALAVENVRAGRGGPFAAIVVRHGEVIARGTNTVTTSNDPTAHAEVNAIRAACAVLGDFQLGDCDIYTTCEPCPMCLGAIYWARPRRIFFGATREDAADVGFDDAMIYREIGCKPEDRSFPMEQLLRDEAQAGFVAWREKGDRVDY